MQILRRVSANTFPGAPGQDQGWGHKVKSSKLDLDGTNTEASKKQAKGSGRLSRSLTAPRVRADLKGQVCDSHLLTRRQKF